ncbi:MAG: hypothetical protein QXD77_02120, partial [Candidatus Aenigmatarchaeota archaeon]
ENATEETPAEEQPPAEEPAEEPLEQTQEPPAEEPAEEPSGPTGAFLAGEGVTTIKVYIDTDNEWNGNEDLIGERTITGEWSGVFSFNPPAEKYTDKTNLVIWSDNGAAVRISEVRLTWTQDVTAEASGARIIGTVIEAANKTNVSFEKIEEDTRYDAIIDESSLSEDGTLTVIFHHNASGPMPVGVDGDVDYSLSTNLSQPMENVTLRVYGWAEDDYFELYVGTATEVMGFGEPKYYDFDAGVKDAKGKNVNVTIELSRQRTGKKLHEHAGTAHALNVKEGVYRIKVKPAEGPVKEITLDNVNISSDISEFVKLDTDVSVEGYAKTYAIDPTAVDFTSANVTVTATGTQLYKCRHWNFTEQRCQGAWAKVMDITPGQDYTFTLTPEDPGFGEINVTKAEHLDENMTFISDVYEEVRARDYNWTEPIHHNEYIRAFFDDNMTNGNIINIYPRNTQGYNTTIEVYDESGSVLVGQAAITGEGQYNVKLSGLAAYNDTFLLKVVNTDNNPDAYLEFDYIHDSNWMVPTSYSADGNWSNGQNAYDDNTGTYASDSSGGYSAPLWGSFITFNLGQNISSDKVRAYADFGYGYTDAVQVDVYVTTNDSWVTVRNGTMLDGQWDEMEYGETLTVSAARFRWHYAQQGAIFWLYEFQFSNKTELEMPSVITANASSLERHSAVMKGQLTSDGGDQTYVRFEYGENTSYGNATEWLPDARSTGSNFTYFLTGLEYNKTYHYRAQAQNSMGLVNGSDVAFTTRIPEYGWLSPNGNLDPNSEWIWEERAYDDLPDSESKAKSYHSMNDPDGQWSFPLILNITPRLRSDTLRFYAKGVDMEAVNVSVLKDGEWVLAYSGAYGDLTWTNVSYSAGAVSAVMFQFKIANNGNGEYWELYEVDILNKPIEVTVNGTITDAEGNPIIHTLEIFNETGALVYNDTGVSLSPSVLAGMYNITIIPENTTIEQVTLSGVEIQNDVENFVGIDNPEDNKGYSELYAIDPTALTFSEGTVTIGQAKGNALYKCANWSFANQSCGLTCELDDENNTNCREDWVFVEGIVPGQPYSITISPADPAFAESSEAVDVAVLPVNNRTFVIAWIDSGEGDASFKVMDTNGTVIVNTVDVDTTVDNQSMIALDAINSTHFIIAWVDGPDDDVTWAVYNVDGTNVIAATDASTGVGNNADVSLAELGDRFSVCYMDALNGDASFRMYYNNGTQAVAETDVDTGATPEATLQNLVSCSGISSTRWVYFYFDDPSNDATFNVRNQTGGSVVGTTDIDTDVGETGQMAVTSLDGDKFAMAFYDATDQDITIAIRYANNTVIKAATDIDTAAGTESRVAVSAARRNDSSTMDDFVVAWWDQNSSDI